MTVTTSHHIRSASEIGSPVDDATYDLLQALTSSCEAIEAYANYQDDAEGATRELFAKLQREEASHAEQLLDALRTHISR